ncbi:MAG: hypothetical protein ACPL3C_08240 [Pyrobaculum sp.]|jgi:hypothetical protein
MRRGEAGYLELRRELKRKMEELGKAARGVRVLPDPKPPGLKIGVLPAEAWPRALRVRPRNPEAWDLCVNFLGDLDCYHKAVRLWGNKDAYALVLRAVMFGADVKAVVDALSRGDFQKARELVYRGRAPAQQIDELVAGRR